MQSKRQSLVETLTNTGVGFVGSWLITMACLLYFTSPFGIATSTTILCTFYSIARGYLIRRYFCSKEAKRIDQMKEQIN